MSLAGIKTYIILGPQGSGKGTQAALLSKRIHAPVISMGEITRSARERNDKTGVIAKSYYDKGMLFPNNLIEKLLTEELKKYDLSKGVIFEGVPRNMDQVEIFDRIVNKLNIPYPKVIYLKISQDIVYKRIQGRKICSLCGTPYLPKDKEHKSGVCSKCGGKLIVRADDKPEAIKKRIESYYSQTEPIIDTYRKRGNLIEINGEPEIQDVSEEINRKLEGI